MLIGLTYDLRDIYLAAGYSDEETAGLDRIDTIDHLERAIKELGHETEPIGHARELVTALARGERWDLVFNLARGLTEPGREAVVPALLDSYKIPYTFSDALAMSLTLDKAMAGRVMRDAGLRTTDFTLAKTLPGRELMVGIGGTGEEAGILGTLEMLRREDLVEYRLARDEIADEAEELAMAAWRLLRCRDAGQVNIQCDAKGRPTLLGVNPLVELHPEHSTLPILCKKLGIPYVDFIGQIVSSASARVRQGRPPALPTAATAPKILDVQATC